MKFPDEADQLRMPREGAASISHPPQKQRRTESSQQTVCFYKRTQGESLCKKKNVLGVLLKEGMGHVDPPYRQRSHTGKVSES